MQGHRGDRRVRLTPAEDDFGGRRGSGDTGGYRDGNAGYDDYGGRAKLTRGPPAGGRERSPRRGAAPAAAGGRARRRDAPAEEDVSASEGGEPAAEDPRSRRPARGGGGEAKARRRADDPYEEAPERMDKPRQAPGNASPPRAAPRQVPLAPPAEPPPRNAVPLSVSGCSNATISAIVKGTYTPYSCNHGKVVYRKDEKAKGFEVLIYYWDDRDGAELCGWWFGPTVGGDQVWAYHPSRSSSSPPSSEWNVPHDGSIDPTFAVTARVDANAKRGAREAVPAADPHAGRSHTKDRQEPAPAPEPRRAEREERRVPSPPPAPRRGERERDAPRREERPDDREPAPRRGDREPAARQDDRREDKHAADDGKTEGSREGAATSAHSYFVEAYNKRRQAAELERRDGQDAPRGDREPPAKSRERPREDREPPREDREAPREDRRRDEADSRRARPESRRRDEEPAPPPARAEEKDRTRSPPPVRAEEKERARSPARDEPPARAGGRSGRDEPPSRDRRAEDRDAPARGGRDDRARDGRGRDAPAGGRDDGRGGRGGGRDDQDDRRGGRGGRENEDDRRKAADERRREDDRKREERREEDKKKDEERKKRNAEEDKEREEAKKAREEERKKEDERRRKEDEENAARREVERKKKEEDMKLKDAELQKKRDEKRAEERLKQEKLDEERREANAAKRAEDQERMKAQREAKVAEDAKAAEEALLRQEEEKKALRQQQATLNVLQVLQKLSSATPENFEELNKDLESALETELPECGQQQEILKAEADRVLEYAKHYVKQVTDQRTSENAAREEKESTAKKLLEELEALVKGAEEFSEGVFYTAAPLSGETTLPDMECVKVSRDVQKLGRAAMAACSQCADFITHKRPIIEEAESIGEESAALIAVLLPRIRSATRRTAEAFQQGKEHREKVEKRVLGKRYVARKEAVFSKYDKDADGYMTKDDVLAYAKAEFNFDIPKDNLARMKKKLFQGPDGCIGVAKEDFQLLKAAVGIARAEERGKIARVERVEREAKETEEREKRQAEVEARKAELQETLKESAKSLTTLEPAIKQAETVAEALAGEAGQLGSEELKAKSDSVDAATQETRDSLEKIRTSIKKIMGEVGEVPELQDFMRGILVPLSSRSDIFDMRLRKALETAASGRQLAQYMALSEYEGLWTEVVVKLRASIESVEGKSVDDLFDHIAGSDITVPEGAPGSEDDTVTTAEVQNFLSNHACDVELEKLDKLFGRNKGAVPAEQSNEAEKTEAESKTDDTGNGSAVQGKEEAKTDKEETKDEEMKADDKEKVEASKDEEQRAAFMKETMPKLRELLEAKGLDTKGRAKKELVDRLLAATGDKPAEDKPVKEGEEASADKKEGDADEAKTETKTDTQPQQTGAEQGEPPQTGTKEDNTTDLQASKAEEGDEKKEADLASIDMAAAAAKAIEKMTEDSREKALAKVRNNDGLHITRSDFKRIVRMYYKVVRHCVLSDNLQIEQSSQIRRMDVGEVIEVHRGPTLDSSVNVYRVFGRCIRDGVNGWGTIAGNTGVTFLMPGGRIFTVKIKVALTEELKDVEGEKLVRQLEEGEVLEVLEWARTSRSALGVTRIRARAQLDNAIGWATTVGNDDNVFLEAM